MILIYLCALSFFLWFLLLIHPDQPYLFHQTLPNEQQQGPKVSIVIPCRNEESILEATLLAITSLDYNDYEVILIDDCSTDNSQKIAKKYLDNDKHLFIVGKELPKNWAGKMWALQQGIEHASGEWILLSDADILYPKETLSQLISIAKNEKYDLVSVMVSLSTKSFWEKLLVPAFVYFFKILYPFKAICKSNRKVAAAAGGCILIKKHVLEEIGGIQAIQGELIDDVALAKKVKSSGFRISLWLSQKIKSIRGYPGLSGLWAMVTRSAFTQLKYSYFKLAVCCFGMTILFLLPIYAIILGGVTHNAILCSIAIATYLLMTLSYIFAVRFYNVPILFSLLLPFIGLLYMLMTLDSARKYVQGTKANWKGRKY